MYKALEKELDLGTEVFINNSGKGIYTCLESILKGQVDEKLKDLKEKLKIE